MISSISIGVMSLPPRPIMKPYVSLSSAAFTSIYTAPPAPKDISLSITANFASLTATFKASFGNGLYDLILTNPTFLPFSAPKALPPPL